MYRYDIKMFPNSNDVTKPVGAHTNYQKRAKLMKKAGTTSNKVLHDDRVFGSFLARMREIPQEEIQALGFWQVTVQQRAYTRLRAPSTIAKMCAFDSVPQYFLQRALLDPESTEDEGIKAFASEIFRDVDRDEWKSDIEKVQRSECDIQDRLHPRNAREGEKKRIRLREM